MPLEETRGVNSGWGKPSCLGDIFYCFLLIQQTGETGATGPYCIIHELEQRPFPILPPNVACCVAALGGPSSQPQPGCLGKTGTRV
jgi:hypothetical protein